MSNGPLATVEDVATFCGVPPATVHAWLYRGTAPRSYKIGKHRRFHWDDVESWLAAHADDRTVA